MFLSDCKYWVFQSSDCQSILLIKLLYYWNQRGVLLLAILHLSTTRLFQHHLQHAVKSILYLINTATSCMAERYFSTARRLKTWLRATMTSKRFNSLAILNTYKSLTDELDLCKIANDFALKHDKRFHQFGKFIKSDF